MGRCLTGGADARRITSTRLLPRFTFALVLGVENLVFYNSSNDFLQVKNTHLVLNERIWLLKQSHLKRLANILLFPWAQDMSAGSLNRKEVSGGLHSLKGNPRYENQQSWVG